MYILGVSVVQVHHGCWVGTSFLLIGGRKPTLVGFLFIGGNKTNLRRFYTGVYKEGLFNSWRGRIFHLARLYLPFTVFFYWKTLLSDNQHRASRISLESEVDPNLPQYKISNL